MLPDSIADINLMFCSVKSTSVLAPALKTTLFLPPMSRESFHSDWMEEFMSLEEFSRIRGLTFLEMGPQDLPSVVQARDDGL